VATDYIKKLNLLLPFVAIGTVADCQSILEPTNRLLVRSGLGIMQAGNFQNSGLSQLLKHTGLQEKISQNYKINSQDLGYTLSPILNSSGRVSHAKLSISTLLSDENEGGKLALELIETNTNRKQMVRDILEEVELEAENQFLEGKKAIWLSGNWSKGIVGLLASRLVNAYNLPVIVVSKESETEATASLRAPEGYNLVKAMGKLDPSLLDKFGGHPGAAGFTTNPGKLEAIENDLVGALSEQEETLQDIETSFIPWDYQYTIPVKLEKLKTKKNLIWLNKEILTPQFLSETMSLDPFGQDFPFPQFVFPLSHYSIKFLGQDEKHAKIFFSGQQVTAFNLDKEIVQEFKKNINEQQLNTKEIWVIAKISQNTWNGSTKNELVAEKIIL